MDLQSLARDLDKLATADAVVADSYLRYVFRKGALYFLASLLAISGLGLLGAALYWLLESSLGAIGAAALVGVIGCLVAGIIATVAVLQRPGREFSVAMEMRRSTISTLEQNIRTNAVNPSAYIYPASEALISSVILPLMGALIRNLRSRNDTAETSSEVAKISGAPINGDAPKA
ncbi:MAG: hypothetical protein QM780_00225 [Hyphomicrobium sp.]|uniref:hypothetical protein n=1 Tax=Hyphomicrobium sp. TaxID=82 RepID=UPI0039E42E6C